MLRDTDVPTMMMRVEATLDAAARSPHGANGVLKVANEGDHHLNVGRTRQLAAIELEFPAGSDRAVVGRAIALAKRGLRRSLRWYVTPMIQQQTRFNHAAVDLFEGLRLSLDRLSRRIDALQQPSAVAAADLLAGCTTIVDIDLDPIDAVEGGSADGVQIDARTGDPHAVAALIESAFAALAPGGRIAILTTTDAAPVPPAAVAWAAEAAGFTQVRQQPVAPPVITPSPTASLAENLDRVVHQLSAPRTTAVVATKPRMLRP